MKVALQAAARFAIGVAPPFHIRSVCVMNLFPMPNGQVGLEIPGGLKSTENAGIWREGTCKAEISLQGENVVVKLTGPGTLGVLRVSGIPVVQGKVFWNGETVALSPGQEKTGTWLYDLYSPVCVVEDVGVSLLHTNLDHTVKMTVLHNAGSRTLQVAFVLDGSLKAGESATYRLAVGNLEPYRRWFLTHYGGVQYVNDTRPVLAMYCSSVEFISPTNPRGFHPDWRGVSSWEAKCRTMQDKGFRRTMLCGASGVCNVHRSLNRPFQMLDGVTGVTAAVKRLRAGGWTCGIQWGHSVTPPVNLQWDSSPEHHVVDPMNWDHPASKAAFAAKREVEAARFQEILLDASWLSPPRKLLQWMNLLGGNVVHEQLHGDLIHRMTPGLISYEPTGRHVMSDWLFGNAGIWVQTFTESAERIKELRELGYTAMAYTADGSVS